MMKYISTAVALKCFSAGPMMRRFYRTMGNTVGNRKRSRGVMPGYYVERLRRAMRVANEYEIVRDGSRVIELGTGWLHWEALTLRLFWDIDAVLFDVWDNRQLGGLKNYWVQLGGLLDKEIILTPEQLRRARSTLDVISRVESFEELYAALGLEYVVESSGSLARFPKDSFNLVVSAGVLEHVSKAAIPSLLAETYRILKPGGIALHSIDTSDHLAHYDASVSKKAYLSCSEPMWQLLFENQVQYINRVQRKEWMDMFESNGFEVIEEDSRYVDLGNIKTALPYARMSRHDLSCTTIRLTLKKR